MCLDIDVDYDYAYKDEVVASEALSNGNACFAKIQTFGSMLAKGVVKDCVRVAGYPPEVGAKISKMIPNELNITLTDARMKNPELDEYIKSDSSVEKLWNIALRLEGLKKSAGTHACGHIPTPMPCEELFPVSVDTKTGYLICQYDMVEAEHLGNLKKDLLMLRNLTVINIAHKAIKERYGVDVPLWTDEVLNDKEALALMSRGETNGVFQFESEGMKKFMRELKPQSFADIIAAVSLYRPGPMDFIPDYIVGKKDPSSITYITPELESILAPTYGCIVYQEQVMQIVQKLAGFSMGRADVVRKAMGKKKMSIMEAEGKNFVEGNTELNIPGCVNNGISADKARAIYDKMIDFAKYAFNKSHAACYAAIAMQTAYLKAHYPLEFTAGLLTSVADDTAKLVIYIYECKQQSISLLAPDINMSGSVFTVKGNDIEFGLNAIKGIGSSVVETIIKEREEHGSYLGLSDFVERTALGKGVLEPLVKAGAFNFTGFSRRAMLANLENVAKGVKKEKKSQVEGQLSIFDIAANDDEGIARTDSYENIAEYDQKQLLQMERDVTGYYISGHPLDAVKHILGKQVNHVASELISHTEDGENISSEEELCVENGEKLTVGGLITSVKKIFTKKDAKPMAFLTIEDFTGEMSIIVFPNQYQKFKDLLEEDRIVVIHGTADTSDEKVNVLADSIELMVQNKSLWIRFENEKEYEMKKEKINTLITKFEGKEDNLVIYLSAEKKQQIRKNIISIHNDLTWINDQFNEKNVKVVNN